MNNEHHTLQTVSMDVNSMPAALKEQIQKLQVSSFLLELSQNIASVLCDTDMVPSVYQGQKNVQNAAVAIYWGQSLNLDPIQSLDSVAVINGRPSLWGDALVAVVLASPKCDYINTKYDAETKTSTVTTRRHGCEEQSRSFSYENAKQAGLTRKISRNTGKNVSLYEIYPERMLGARARSFLLRDVYADLLNGFQVTEVLQEDAENTTPPSNVKTLKTVMKTEKSQDVQKEVPKPPIDQVEENTEDISTIFEQYKQRLQIADISDIPSVGQEIGKDGRLTELQVSELRTIYGKRTAVG